MHTPGVLTDLLARVWLSRWATPGDEVLGDAVWRYGAVETALAVSGALPRRHNTHGTLLPRPPAELTTSPLDTQARAVLAAGHRAGTHALVPGDVSWPAGLRDLGPGAPLVLWVAGSVDSIASIDHAVAIVGTRRASDAGKEAAAVIARNQTTKKRVVVSGGARGIDIAAQRASHEAGGRTVAVLPRHPARPYPPEHRDDFASFARRGAVLSEMSPGRAPRATDFLARNRLIAALCAVTVLVEAPLRSGSVNTCRLAAELGRDVVALEWEEQSPGSTRVVEQYAAQGIAWG